MRLVRTTVLASACAAVALAGCEERGIATATPSPGPSLPQLAESDGAGDASSPAQDSESPAGTAEDRARLFDGIVRHTLEREAFSQVKDQKLGLDFKSQAATLRDGFIAAGTEDQLLRALVRLSNLRKNEHLKVDLAAGGLDYPDAPWRQAPIRFDVDFSDPERLFLFVTDVDSDISKHIRRASPIGRVPEVGDKLVAVNGQTMDRYVDLIAPFIRYSTIPALWLKMAVDVTVWRTDFPPELYEENVSYNFIGANGATYTVTLPYLDPGEIKWRVYATPAPLDSEPYRNTTRYYRHAWSRPKSYPGFEEVLETDSFSMYLREGTQQKVLLLNWHEFEDALPSDIERLTDFASSKGYLDYDVIADFTSSRGGSGSWYLLQRLVSEPFKVTLGNLHISDVIPGLVAKLSDREEPRFPGSDSSWLRDWLNLEVMPAFRRKQWGLTRAVPFKLHALPPEDQAGVLEPAPVHFRGRLVCLFGPMGISQVDQLAAMVIDNNLAHTIGMPTAGSSNTWEWKEEIRFEGRDQPLANWEWCIGNTLRPNGEILEGNPPQPAEFVAQTRENYVSYFRELVTKALQHLVSNSQG